MAPGDSLWLTLALFSTLSLTLAYGAQWLPIARSWPIRLPFSPNVSLWLHMAPNGSPMGFLWLTMAPYAPL